MKIIIQQSLIFLIEDVQVPVIILQMTEFPENQLSAVNINEKLSWGFLTEKFSQFSPW